MKRKSTYVLICAKSLGKCSPQMTPNEFSANLEITVLENGHDKVSEEGMTTHCANTTNRVDMIDDSYLRMCVRK